MFDVLTKGFRSAQLALQGKTQLTEENLAPALREVRTSLLQADVELSVAKAFLERVKDPGARATSCPCAYRARRCGCRPRTGS